ncbi:hypothetical protein [Candidatus Poriferisodalis sp.]|uniref:hypothetical protein n=1 Tax=Candidatus Poriferisodalis sp. TaxID=3101277 RepID=UPI003AF7E4F7
MTAGIGTESSQRTLTVSLPAGTSSTVTVTCTNTGNTDGIEKALFTADAVTEVASVTVTGGEACTAAPGDLPDGVDQAFECAVALDGTAALSVTAAASHATISLAWTTASDDVTVTLGTVPDDDAPGLDGHWHTTTTATLGCTAAGTHTATLTVTAGTGTDTDTHTTRFTVTCGTVVQIDGLEDTTGSGAGAVTVSDEFAVTPATAQCTALPVGTVTEGPEGVVGGRVVSVDFPVPGTASVTVRCSYGIGTETAEEVEFVHAGEIGSLGVRTVGGGRCDPAAVTPSGVEAALVCVMAPGRPFVVAADASANTALLGVAWAVGADVTLDGHDAGVVSPSFGFGATTSWHRTATATLGCTAAGTATATATLPGAGSKTVQLSVSCLDAVEITGLEDASGSGSGSLGVADEFTVVPATAVCTPSVGTVTTDTEGPAGNRTLTVPLVAPDRERVTVSCTAGGRAGTDQTVTFDAVEPCSDDLGRLAPGAVTRSGTVTADASCTSSKRRPASSWVYYTRRHTFSLAQRSWVTVELESASSNARRLDTYVVLLEGHSPNGSGARLDHNDDVGSGHGTYRLNSRLSGVELDAGSYTIEATTWGIKKTGDYDLAVSAVTVNGLTNAMHVVQNKTASFVFDYAPPDAVLSIPPDELSAGVTAALTHGGGSATLTVTAANTGTYTANINLAIPQTTAAATRGTRSITTRTTATHAPVDIENGGTVCTTAQTVVIAGSSVCVSSAGPSVTIRKPADGDDPAITIPDSCVQSVPLGRWYLTSRTWPINSECVVPVDGTDHVAQYFAFEIRDLSAKVTIRLSSDDQDTYLALYSNDPIVDGIGTINLDDAHAHNDNVFDDADEDDEFVYRDEHITDSRLEVTLSRGVYAVAATTATSAAPSLTDEFTFNIKIPTSTCPAPPRDGSGS